MKTIRETLQISYLPFTPLYFVDWLVHNCVLVKWKREPSSLSNSVTWNDAVILLLVPVTSRLIYWFMSQFFLHTLQNVLYNIAEKTLNLWTFGSERTLGPICLSPLSPGPWNFSSRRLFIAALLTVWDTFRVMHAMQTLSLCVSSWCCELQSRLN